MDPRYVDSYSMAYGDGATDASYDRAHGTVAYSGAEYAYSMLDYFPTLIVGALVQGYSDGVAGKRRRYAIPQCKCGRGSTIGMVCYVCSGQGVAA